MHNNLLFDLDQTLLDFHASERLGVRFVMEQNGLEFTEELYTLKIMLKYYIVYDIMSLR